MIKYPGTRPRKPEPEPLGIDRETTVLRSTAIDRPTTDPYRFPPNYEGLREYQVVGVDWLRRHPMALLADEMGLGKAQPLSSRVLTPSGWVEMGALSVGDEVIDPDGGVGQVLSVHPQGRLPAFRLWTADGCSTRCSADHLWHVLSPNDRFRGSKGRVLKTCELEPLRSSPSAEDGRTHRRWFLPVMEPATLDQSCATEPDLHPYILGVLLGDGSLRAASPMWNKPDEQIAQQIAPLLPSSVEIVRHQDMNTWGITLRSGAPRPNPVRSALQRLGVNGLYSWERFIPSAYTTSSIENRIHLLRGLCDTDGDCTSDGTVMFNTSSLRLRDDVTALVRSLGGIASISSRDNPKYAHLGEVRTGRPAFRVNIRLPFNPFALDRKASRWKKPLMVRGIESIEPDGEDEMQCIRVSTKRSLYVTDDFIVTHNTIVYLRFLPIGARTIVVCPAHLQLMWQKRCREWRPDLTPIVGEELCEPRQSELHIHSYDSLPDPPGNAKVLLPSANLRGVHIGLDEAHYVMNHKAARTYRTRCLTKQSKRVTAMTGTPLPNYPKQLWGVLASAQIAFKVFGSWDGFLSCYDVGNKVIGRNEFGEFQFATDWKEAKPLPTVAEKLRPFMLRRLRREVAKDLPDKEYNYVHVQAPDELVFMLDEVEKKWVDKTELPPFEMMSAVRAALSRARIPDATAFVKDAMLQAPLAVFSAHVDPILALKDIPGVTTMTGEESTKEKHERIEGFQRGDFQVFACTIKTATGFDLTRASHAFFIDLDYTPGNNDQAEDRLPRIGQTADKILITRMLTDHPLDTRILELLTVKKHTISTSLGDEARQ